MEAAPQRRCGRLPSGIEYYATVDLRSSLGPSDHPIKGVRVLPRAQLAELVRLVRQVSSVPAGSMLRGGTSF